MTEHRLKTWPPYYDAAEAGIKTFEARVNDRDFRPGDRVTLARYDPDSGEFDGRELTFDVPYVLRGGGFGVRPGYAVLSLVPVPADGDGRARLAYRAYSEALGIHKTPGYKTWDQLHRDRQRAWRAVAAATGGRA
jgi:uncharacterized protein DUF3850